jgi:Domain of unknown function (DUF4178)
MAEAEKTKFKPQVRELKCTNCGSPLKLYGGHQIETVTCASCGSQLDAQEDYKVIAQMNLPGRANFLFKPGMTAKIKDVDFVVTGIVRYVERDEDGTYYTTAFQLFSPTHGYAALEMYNNNFIFVREVRDLPTQGSFGGIKARDMTFKVDEIGEEKIDYVCGELSWVAKKGDTSKYSSYVNPPYTFEMSQAKNEIEYSFGEWLGPEEVFGAFGLKKPKGFRCGAHPAKPIRGIWKSVDRASMICFFLSLILLALFWVGARGTQICNISVPYNKYARGEEVVGTFEVTQPGKLMRMDLRCNLSNAWTYFQCAIMKDANAYLTVEGQISYYSGADWSEGSRSIHAYFTVPEAGKYSIVVKGEGGTGETGRTMQGTTLEIRVREGVMVTRYFILSTILLFFLWSKTRNCVILIIKKMKDASDD